MTLSMYQASVPVFRRQLDALSAILTKAEEHAEARKLDPAARSPAAFFPTCWRWASKYRSPRTPQGRRRATGRRRDTELSRH